MGDKPQRDDRALKEILKRESAHLDKCPFCGGNAEFVSDKSGNIIIAHYPNTGFNCPARYEQVCDTFEQGRFWWNMRFQK